MRSRPFTIFLGREWTLNLKKQCKSTDLATSSRQNVQAEQLGWTMPACKQHALQSFRTLQQSSKVIATDVPNIICYISRLTITDNFIVWGKLPYKIIGWIAESNKIEVKTILVQTFGQSCGILVIFLRTSFSGRTFAHGTACPLWRSAVSARSDPRSVESWPNVGLKSLSYDLPT